ncbi:MAG: peptide ABC transporter substrate-binding protein [Proteobacteria bacterium]|nr:MAG: peptide ABC transporter substrate-binding protein [Pseudomonadota bacterium]
MGVDLDTYEDYPMLAEKSEISKDGKQFTFTLRKGAKWSDGKPVTAEDVKFSFDVIFDPKYSTAHKRPYYEQIEKAEIISPDTVRFTVKSKYFLNFRIVASMAIVPKHIYGNAAEGSKLNKTLIGSGPYKIEKYDKGQSMVLVRNKEWWGNNVASQKGSYNFERIRFRFLKDSNISIEALKKGDIDFAELTPEEYTKKTSGSEWGKAVAKVKTENVSPKDYGWIGWNMRREMFKDKNVRIALAHLVNRDEMNQKFRFGMSVPATGPWYVQSEYADPSVKPIAYDPKKAIEMLKAAGWVDSDKDGVLDKTVGGKKVNFSFSIMYGNKDTEKYWVMYQGDLKKVGIDMRLQFMEWNAMLKAMDEFNFDAITLRWTGSVDPDPKQIWHSASAVKGGSNVVGYSNPEVDKLIDEARMELDKKKRIPLLRTVYKRIAEDAPYAFLFVDKYVTYAHSTKVAMPKPTYKYDVGTTYWWSAQ